MYEELIERPECANGHGKMGIVDDGDGGYWCECHVCGNNEEDNHSE